MGIEPTSSAWKAEVLPLNYTRPQTRARFTAFGMTKRAGRSAANDETLAGVVNAGTPDGLPCRQDP